jgi:hypothetical protein
MRLGAALIGALGALAGLIATLWVSGGEGARQSTIWSAGGACAVGLLGAWVVGRRRLLGVALLVESAVATTVFLSEAGLIPTTLLLVAAALAFLSR